MITNFSKELIFDRVKAGYPYWSLYVQKSYGNRSHIGSYSGDDWTDEDTQEAKIQKSLTRLDALLNSLPSGVNLSIDIKNSKTANGNGIIGPLEFSLGPTSNETVTTTQPQTLGQIPSGYWPKEFIDERQTLNEAKYQADLAKMRQDLEHDAWEREKKRDEADLQRRRQELDDEKKKYESGVGKTADILLMAGTKILQGIAPNLFAPAKTAQLGAAPAPSKQSQPEEPLDAKAAKLEEIAAKMYHNFSDTEIASIDALINKNLEAKKNEVLEES